jgi:hypothetical protein
MKKYSNGVREHEQHRARVEHLEEEHPDQAVAEKEAADEETRAARTRFVDS